MKVITTSTHSLVLQAYVFLAYNMIYKGIKLSRTNYWASINQHDESCIWRPVADMEYTKLVIDYESVIRHWVSQNSKYKTPVLWRLQRLAIPLCNVRACLKNSLQSLRFVWFSGGLACNCHRYLFPNLILAATISQGRVRALCSYLYGAEEKRS